jgi:hypothetical protein
VRITPNEVQFEDPEFNDVLYPSLGKRKIDRPEYAAARAGSKFSKRQWMNSSACMLTSYFRLFSPAPGSIVATAQHDVHRRRRNALNSFFSGASVRRLEPIIQEHMNKMLVRMQKSGEQCEVAELHHMFKACASDIITLYAFGDSFHFMDQPDNGKPYFQAGEAFGSMTHVFGAFPWLLTLVTSAPGWLIKYLNPEMTEFVDRRNVCYPTGMVSHLGSILLLTLHVQWWVEKVPEIRNSKNPEQAKNTISGGILDSSLPAADKTD